MLTSVRVGPPTAPSAPQFQFPAMAPPPRSVSSALASNAVPPRFHTNSSQSSRGSSPGGYVVGSGSLNVISGPSGALTEVVGSGSLNVISGPSGALSEVMGHGSVQGSETRGGGSLNISQARSTQSASLAEALGPSQPGSRPLSEDGKTWRTPSAVSSVSSQPGMGSQGGSGTFQRSNAGSSASNSDQVITPTAPVGTTSPLRGDVAADKLNRLEMSPVRPAAAPQPASTPQQRRIPSSSPDITPRRFSNHQNQRHASPPPNGVPPASGAAFTAARSAALLATASKAKGERATSPGRAPRLVSTLRTPTGDRPTSPGRSSPLASPVSRSPAGAPGVVRPFASVTTPMQGSSDVSLSPSNGSPISEIRASSRTRPRVPPTAVPRPPKSGSPAPSTLPPSLPAAMATRVPLRPRSMTNLSDSDTPSRSSQHSLATTPVQTPPIGRGWHLPERGFSIVFLLPNVAESAEFMEVVFNSFLEDNPDAPELSRVVLRMGDDVAQVHLSQLCPVDALEDVQRRARKVQSRRPPVPLRRSALRPRFVPLNGLPRVDDAMTASCTMVVYLVRPFESAKDTERQLGPICIIETSYGNRGSSHAFCPGRMVVALEENASENHVSNGDSPAVAGAGASSGGSSGVWTAPPNGQFGAEVAERLRQRGVDLPVISLEKRIAGRHRWLVQHISEMLLSRSRGTVSSNVMNNILCSDGASASTDAAADTDRTVEVKPPMRESISQCPSVSSTVSSPAVASTLSRPNTMPTTPVASPVSPAPMVVSSISSMPPTPGTSSVAPSVQTTPSVTPSSGSAASVQAPRDRPTTAEVAAITSALKAAGVPVTGAREAKHNWAADSPAPPTRTSSASSTLSASMPAASHSAPTASHSSSTPSRVSATAATPVVVEAAESHGLKPAEAQVLTRADVEAAAAEAFAAACAVPEAVDVRAATEAAEAARIAAERFQAKEEAAAAMAEQAEQFPIGAQKGSIGAAAELGAGTVEEETDNDSASIPAPIVQVGESRFCLPRPDVAVQRIAELWRPGAAMVVITTQHYGTPLLCPDGDIMKGLVNIAPSSEGGQQLVPLFWQNIEEAEQEEANSLEAAGGAGGVGGLAGSELPSSGVLRLSRSSQLTKVEEEEEDEEG